MNRVEGKSTKAKRDWWKCPLCSAEVLRRDMVQRMVRIGVYKLNHIICETCAEEVDSMPNV